MVYDFCVIVTMVCAVATCSTFNFCVLKSSFIYYYCLLITIRPKMLLCGVEVAYVLRTYIFRKLFFLLPL